ncbi:MAG: hypothetical protein Kow0029_25630 [Candidatus Rifleibacteriota bacterium]
MSLSISLKKLKALSDLTRLRVFLLLFSFDEICSCYFVEFFGVSAPTISRHTAILCEAGLIKGRKEGRWVYFSLNRQDKHFKYWLEFFENDLKAREAVADRKRMLQILEKGCKKV